MHMQVNNNRVVLLISCPERKGIISSVSGFLLDHGANIVQFDQHTTNHHTGVIFIRIEIYLPDFKETYDKLVKDFEELAKDYEMNWHISNNRKRERMAIFVSKEGHCLEEILWRWKSGELPVEIPLVISNHNDMRSVVEAYNIPYHHIPVTPDTKQEAEKQMLKLLEEENIDFIILARYMQILSPNFVKRFPNRVINIHHSFLPAFIGANPYVRAFNRGVKLIGATAHYVTNDLDEGPIIEQDVERVSHRHTAEDLKISGRHVEKQVFARAVAWHLEARVMVHGNKTIVFN